MSESGIPIEGTVQLKVRSREEIEARFAAMGAGWSLCGAGRGLRAAVWQL